MRVALLTNNLMPPREGIARHVLEVAKRLPGHGIEPHIIAKGTSLRIWQHVEIEGVQTSLYPYLALRPFHQEALRLTLQPWLDKGAGGADLLHIHLPLLPRLRTGLPRLVTFHSPLLADTAAIHEPGMVPSLVRANARLFGQAYEHAQIRAAAAIIAVSGNVKTELEEHYRLDGKEPMVLGSGVDTSFFMPAQTPVPSGPKSILYVGRLGFRKGLTRLLETFARLEPKNDLRLEIAGEGPLRSKLEAHAQQLGITERVHFSGFVNRPELRAALQRAAVFVNPADYESGPLTLLEAMACGTPAVTTPTGLVGDLPADPPLTVATAEVNALVTAVMNVLADPEAANRRARQARRLVETDFSWDAIAARLGGFYPNLVRRAA